MDDAPAAEIGAHQVGQLQCRLAKKHAPAFSFQSQQRPLDGRHGLRTHQSVYFRYLRALFRNQCEQCAQVVQVKQKQPLVIGQFEHNFQCPGLSVAETQDPRQQTGANLTYRGAYGMPAPSKDIPEHHRVRLMGIAFDADLLRSLLEFLIGGAGRRQPGNIPLNVRNEHRHAQPGEAFRQDHQRDGLARAGRARDHAVAVAIFREQMDLLVAFADKYPVHRVHPPWPPGSRLSNSTPKEKTPHQLPEAQDPSRCARHVSAWHAQRYGVWAPSGSPCCCR